MESNVHEDGALSSEEDDDDADSHTHHTNHHSTAAPSNGNTAGGAHNSNNASFRAGAPAAASSAAALTPAAAAHFARKAPAQATGQEFIIQLATTRKMLLSVLEKHDAVPDKVRHPCAEIVLLRCGRFPPTGTVCACRLPY
jgi:hypothetical protein